MMSVREPILKTVAIADLRPTQMTVGVREVEEKRKRWLREKSASSPRTRRAVLARCEKPTDSGID
jgi:hypothetical protein